MHDPAARRQQPQDRQARHCLAAPGFTHEAEGLATGNREAHAVDRPHHTPAGEEMGREVLDLEQRRADGAAQGVTLKMAVFAGVQPTVGSQGGTEFPRRVRDRPACLTRRSGEEQRQPVLSLGQP
jgi:hypothetical protein